MASPTADWTRAYTIDYSGGLTAPSDSTSTVGCPADATDPGAPADIPDACGRTVSAVLVGSTQAPACEGTVVWTYRYTACDNTTTADWTHTYTIDYSGGLTAPSDSTSTVSLSCGCGRSRSASRYYGCLRTDGQCGIGRFLCAGYLRRNDCMDLPLHGM